MPLFLNDKQRQATRRSISRCTHKYYVIFYHIANSGIKKLDNNQAKKVIEKTTKMQTKLGIKIIKRRKDRTKRERHMRTTFVVKIDVSEVKI